jgi:membrane protein required for colicin V production
MSLLDLLLIVILAWSIVTGFIAGFARAAVAFCAAIAGIVLGFWFYGIPAGWYTQWVDSEKLANLLGFFTVFFGTALAGAIVGRILSKLLKWTGLSWLDRILGAGFGLVRGSLIAIAFVAVIVAFTPRPVPNWMSGSVLLPYAVDASHVAAALAPRALKDAFTDTLTEIRKLWSEEVRRAKEHREK